MWPKLGFAFLSFNRVKADVRLYSSCVPPIIMAKGYTAYFCHLYSEGISGGEKGRAERSTWPTC